MYIIVAMITINCTPKSCLILIPQMRRLGNVKLLLHILLSLFLADFINILNNKIRKLIILRVINNINVKY